MHQTHTVLPDGWDEISSHYSWQCEHTPIKHSYLQAGKCQNANTQTRAHTRVCSMRWHEAAAADMKQVCVCVSVCWRSERGREIRGGRSSSWLITATKAKESGGGGSWAARLHRQLVPAAAVCVCVSVLTAGPIFPFSISPLPTWSF